jgi:hypothetical protein
MRRMREANLAVVLMSALLMACAHPAFVPPTTSPRVSDHTQIVFRVRGEPGPMLKGVRLSAIAHDGSEFELGQTDMFGILSVPKDTLRSHGARVVLFAHEGFFTGAMRIDDPQLTFYDFDEHYIVLARFELI